MAADVTGFLAVVMMALATMTAIVGGYLLLNTAVSNIARSSSYYTFLRISDSISNSFKSSGASATNLFLSPQYVLFTASFADDANIPYYEFDGQRMNHIVINYNGKDALFEQIVASSSGLAVFNKDVTTRIELSKCSHDVCFCLGEMTTYLNLDEDYLTPGACVEICWGEDLSNYPDTEGYSNYDSCLNNNKDSSSYPDPKSLYTLCNAQAAVRANNRNCKRCVDYMNNFDTHFEIIEEEGYTVLTLKADTEDPNTVNRAILEEFSNAVKFSFIPSIIECKSMSELAQAAGRNSYCSAGPPLAPYLFNYVSSEADEGIFGILTVEDDSDYEDGVLFKLINIEYFQDEVINPSVCYSANTFIKAEVPS